MEYQEDDKALSKANLTQSTWKRSRGSFDHMSKNSAH